MLTLFTAPFMFVRALLKPTKELAVENLALRQQLAVFKHKTKRPKLRKADRIFWVWLSRLSVNWRSLLIIVQPDTVVRWHRLGFKLYWTWKSRSRRTGRPRIDPEIRRQIRRMCRDNPLWGVPGFCLNWSSSDSTYPKAPSGSTCRE